MHCNPTGFAAALMYFDTSDKDRPVDPVSTQANLNMHLHISSGSCSNDMVVVQTFKFERSDPVGR